MPWGCLSTNELDSEKHSKKEEAKARLNEGVSFNKVAEEFSEDKAKQGMLFLAAHHRAPGELLANAGTSQEGRWA